MRRSRALIALFAAFLLALSGAPASQADLIQPGTFDGDIQFPVDDRIWYSDSTTLGRYIFHGDATIQTTNQGSVVMRPINTDTDTDISITVADGKTLSLLSDYNSSIGLGQNSTMQITGR